MATADRSDIPRHLVKRIIRDAEIRPGGEMVVVWLRVAVRGHENPALDLGRRLAAALGRPLLVYHAVSERYPHASDRHHRFILEGARDLVKELDELGIASACHVERPGHRGPVLKQLAARSCVVVADAMPLDPLRAWTASLATHGPVISVDASCTVPMHALSSCPERAFAFREAAARLRDPVAWPWPEETSVAEPFVGPLPFEPVDLRQADIAELVAACAIDHRVPPVADTTGGARAGYARWAAFRDGPLSRYSHLRNDAAKPWGVSRMSAYLHYGHVSPFRIAREASERGANKFLDELLTWREMAWHICFHEAQARGIDALPAWARETLAAHADDPRELLPLERLEHARTGEPLWDLAQRSLIRHGELHNNVRMTWGKQVLQWSRGPRQTLARLYELNDRFALDGRDPSSVGGIQWCLGGQDRPFSPARPVFGEVRGRGIESHAARLDLDTYRSHVERPGAEIGRVLVIGAGICGAQIAHDLALHGVDVSVVDKARGPGGRMASRRTPEGRYDHGAQSFTARDPRFVRQTRLWEAAGWVAPWAGRLARHAAGEWREDAVRGPRWVPVPRMSALTRHLLADLSCSWQTRVVRATRDASGFLVEGESGPLGHFDRVVVTAPAAQARELSIHAAPSAAAQLAEVEVAPCWAGMVSGELGLPFDAARVEEGPIAWLARQDMLPGRVGAERWVVHAREDWSRRHLELEREEASSHLGEALGALIGSAAPHVNTHRWRFARVVRPHGADVLEEDGWLVAGDACLGPRVESAWLSAAAAVGRLLSGARP